MIRRRGEAEVVNANLMTVPVDPTPAVGGYVYLGVVSGARGMKGEVRIKSFAEQAENIAAYGPVYDESGERSWRIKVTGQARGQVIARLDGVEDRAGAEALKGLRLHGPREALPPRRWRCRRCLVAGVCSNPNMRRRKNVSRS